MIVLAFGGRRLNNRELVFRKLDAVHAKNPITLLIHGACPNYRGEDGIVIWSADMLAQAWAQSREVTYCGQPAKWRTGTLGKGEGPSA